jgi:putative heme iron utilization protein
MREMDATDCARALMAQATTAALGTLSPDGYPVTTLVAVAPNAAGAPLLLLSRLALHTKNLAADPRASLLLRDEGAADPGGAPLARPRVTLVGRILASAEASDRACFLARHPQARAYAGFTDFGFYAMAIQRAHLVAGFGRIVELAGTDLAGGHA